MLEILFVCCQLYLMQSIYTIDLETEGGDPLCRGMIPESVFRISNFDPSVTTRTVIQCLSDVVDRRYQSVNFELYWCNDTTFLVAASRKPFPRTSPEITILREHGSLILEALKRRFPTEEIVSWVDYTAMQEADNPKEADHWSSRIGQFLKGLLGWPMDKSIATRKREVDTSEEADLPHAKRRRIR